jgi:hypothetical protein
MTAILSFHSSKQITPPLLQMGCLIFPFGLYIQTKFNIAGILFRNENTKENSNTAHKVSCRFSIFSCFSKSHLCVSHMFLDNLSCLYIVKVFFLIYVFIENIFIEKNISNAICKRNVVSIREIPIHDSRKTAGIAPSC